MLLFPCCFSKNGWFDVMFRWEVFNKVFNCSDHQDDSFTVWCSRNPGQTFFHRCPTWFTRAILLDVCGMMLVSGRWLVYLCMPMLIKHIFQGELTLLRTDISPFASKVLQHFLKHVRHKYTKYLWLILNIYLDKRLFAYHHSYLFSSQETCFPFTESMFVHPCFTSNPPSLHRG